jgi:uncharacterized short protein YbdD (DUF466 family)
MDGGSVGTKAGATAANRAGAAALRAVELRATAAEAIVARSRPAVLRWLAGGWAYLRAVSGDDAYERYLAHHAVEHAGQPPMSRKAYFAERQRRKWTGVTRCC